MTIIEEIGSQFGRLMAQLFDVNNKLMAENAALKAENEALRAKLVELGYGGDLLPQQAGNGQ